MDKQYTYEQFIEDSRQLFEENRELPVPDKGQPVNRRRDRPLHRR